jgi:hypothetical protein
MEHKMTLQKLMEMNEVECGVEYVANGNTLSIVGEWEEGEVHLNDVFVGYYEKSDDDGIVYIVDKHGKRIASFEDSEAGYEDYAEGMLA